MRLRIEITPELKAKLNEYQRYDDSNDNPSQTAKKLIFGALQANSDNQIAKELNKNDQQLQALTLLTNQLVHQNGQMIKQLEQLTTEIQAKKGL